MTVLALVTMKSIYQALSELEKNNESAKTIEKSYIFL